MIWCMAQDSELCTASEAAEAFEVSAETVRRWARDGKIAAIKLPSGRVKFRRSDIAALRVTTGGAAA